MIEAPLYEDIAGGPQGGVAHWLTTADDVRIRVATWHAPNPKGTVLVFPGRTEYIEKHGRTAKAFVERGFTCIAVDWRGQGIADRVHPDPAVGHVEKFTDYQHDVAAVMDHVAALDLPKPYFLVGHSMGGAIGLRAVMDGLDVNACGFSSPMWGVNAAPHVRAYGWIISWLAKTFGFTHRYAPLQQELTYVLRDPFEGNTLTTDEASWNRLGDMVRKYPEMALGGASMGFLYTTLRELRTLASRPSPDMDCLTFMGTEEAIVDPERVKSRMAKWPRGTLNIIEGAQHEMLMDTDKLRDQLIDGYTAVFEANLTK